MPPKSRPKLLTLSPEMKHICAALISELSTWPGVTMRPMFGFCSVYRGRKIFAVLPKTRQLEIPGSVAYKEGREWKSVEVGRALAVLERVYEALG